MIATVRNVPAGAGLTHYITKNGRADIVKTNLLTEGLPPQGMWNEMKMHFDRYKGRYSQHPLKYPAMELIVSLAIDDSENMTREQLADLAAEILHEVDSVDKVTDKRGRVFANLRKTNFSNSQFFAGVHKDSKGGKVHFHLMANHLDINGSVNDTHHLGLRCVAAAEAINRRHGWTDPQKIREDRIKRINASCEDVLKHMDHFDINKYIGTLRFFGWDVQAPPDKQGVIHGYSFVFGKSSIKASDLGVGRCYTVKNLEKTWKKLHGDYVAEQKAKNPEPIKPETPSRPKSRFWTLEDNTDYEMLRQLQAEVDARAARRESERPSFFSSLIHIGDKDYEVSMPWEIHDEIGKAVDEGDYGNAERECVFRPIPVHQFR